MKTIGVLSLQGGFDAHARAVVRIGAIAKEVRRHDDFTGLDALIIPGGESTAMIKLLFAFGLEESVRRMHRDGKALFGTCAGSILLCETVVESDQFRFGMIDATIERNGYGRQNASFEAMLPIPALGEPLFPGVFIRAPKIRSVGRSVTTLADHGGQPVMASSGNILITTFHPELSEDTRIHEYFLNHFVV